MNAPTSRHDPRAVTVSDVPGRGPAQEPPLRTEHRRFQMLRKKPGASFRASFRRGSSTALYLNSPVKERFPTPGIHYEDLCAQESPCATRLEGKAFRPSRPEGSVRRTMSDFFI